MRYDFDSFISQVSFWTRMLSVWFAGSFSFLLSPFFEITKWKDFFLWKNLVVIYLEEFWGEYEVFFLFKMEIWFQLGNLFPPRFLWFVNPYYQRRFLSKQIISSPNSINFDSGNGFGCLDINHGLCNSTRIGPIPGPHNRTIPSSRSHE